MFRSKIGAEKASRLQTKANRGGPYDPVAIHWSSTAAPPSHTVWPVPMVLPRESQHFSNPLS